MRAGALGAAAVGALDDGAAVRGGHGVVHVGAVAQEQPGRPGVSNRHPARHALQRPRDGSIGRGRAG